MTKMKRFLLCTVCMLSMSVTAFGASVYPSSIEEVDADGKTEIHKVYELKEGESPASIPQESFEQDGKLYVLKDILKAEVPEHETKEITEPVTVESATNKMEDILPLIPATKEIMLDDGFSGTLELDVSTIEIESKGTGTSSYTMKATRTYPNLAGADLQYIPKTTEENGHTLQFASVDWQSDNTANVDTYAITDRYTAVVTYEGTGTRTYSKGYIVTAEYKGLVSKTSTKTTQYTAIFAEDSAFSFDLTYVLLPLCGAGVALAVLAASKKMKKGAKGDDESEKNETDESDASDDIDSADDNRDDYPGVCD